MNRSVNRFHNDPNQTTIFEISLINKQNQPLIQPSLSFLNALKAQLHPTAIKTLSNTSINFPNALVNFPKSTKIYPILWIDCNTNILPSAQTSIINQTNFQLKRLFQQTLSNTIQFPLQTQQIPNSSNKKFFSAKKSPQASISQKYQKGQHCRINDKGLLITSKFIKAQTKQQKAKDIMFIDLTLFLNDKSLKNLNRDLIAMASFLVNDIVVNCSQMEKTNENILMSLIESFQQMAQSKKSSSKILMDKKRVHFIGGNIMKESMTKGKNNISFSRIKDLNNKIKVIQCLVKVKQKYLQSLDVMFGKQQVFTLKQFETKYLIASKILQNQTPKSSYFGDFLFDSQSIRKASEFLSKQLSYSQEQHIRMKFENFYNCFYPDHKTVQLPLPQPIIKFRIQQLIKTELKEISSKDLLDKVCSQYQKKILQKNEKYIEKLLLTSMAQFLSSIFSPNSPQNQQRQTVHLHPEKVTNKIRQFIQTMQQSHVFITQNQINKYIRPEMLFNYYKRLYDEYGKVKRSISGNQVSNEKTIQQLKRQVRKMKLDKQETVREAEITKYNRKHKDDEIEKYKSELMALRDQLVVWKDKYENCHRNLLDQIKFNAQQQKNIRDGPSTNNLESKSSVIQQKHESNQLNLTLLQEIISKSGKQEQKLTKSFENHFNIFKTQYIKLQSELRDKVRLIDHKQQIHKQKISQLEKQLVFFKSACPSSFEVQLQNELWRQGERKEIETLYQKRLDLFRTQFEEKLQTYKNQTQQLEQMTDEKNQKISTLNQLIYNYKKQIIELQDKLNQNKKILKDQHQKVSQLVKILQEKNLHLNVKSQDNLILTEKIKQKNIKIQILQEDISNLKSDLKNQESANKSYNLSFLKFQKDLIRPLSHKKPSEPAMMNSSKSNFEQTPQKRVNRIKTVSQINENLQLQKLIQQRRTIEKKKQRFSQQESLLQKMEKKLLGAKSEIKSSSRNHSGISFTKQIDQNRDSCQRVLKQSNRITPSKSSFDMQSSSSNLSTECRRRLF